MKKTACYFSLFIALVCSLAALLLPLGAGVTIVQKLATSIGTSNPNIEEITAWAYIFGQTANDSTSTPAIAQSLPLFIGWISIAVSCGLALLSFIFAKTRSLSKILPSLSFAGALQGGVLFLFALTVLGLHNGEVEILGITYSITYTLDYGFLISGILALVAAAFSLLAAFRAGKSR